MSVCWLRQCRRPLWLMVIISLAVVFEVSSSFSYVAPPRIATSRAVPSMGFGRRIFRRNNNKRVVSSIPILVKPRPMVTMNVETGEYVKVMNPSKRKNQRRGKWDSFKEVVYGTADRVASVPKLFRRNNKEKNDITFEGYNDVVEELFESPGTTTPGQRLMKQLEENPNLLQQQQDPPAPASKWDDFKSGVYGAADLFFADEMPETTKPRPLPTTMKSVTQPSIATSPQIKQALPNLVSTNPITKLKAEFSIREWEKEQARIKRDMKRDEVATSVKESVYEVFDAIGEALVSLSSLPQVAVQTSQKAQKWARSSLEWISLIPKRLELFAKDVQAIPGKVEQSIQDTQASIDSGIEITKVVVNDVKSIPQTVSNSVEDAKQSVLETQKSLQEAVYNVKVLVGAEKPKPRPPSIPPPEPLSAKKVAQKVAGATAVGAGKVAWWLGKGAVSLTLQGAKVLFAKASETMEQQQQQQARQVNEPVLETKMDFSTATKTDESIDDISEKVSTLDVDVSEAMKLAEQALKLANDSTTGKSKLDEAVEKAKKAAMEATRDAVEIEETLKQNK